MLCATDGQLGSKTPTTDYSPIIGWFGLYKRRGVPDDLRLRTRLAKFAATFHNIKETRWPDGSAL